MASVRFESAHSAALQRREGALGGGAQRGNCRGTGAAARPKDPTSPASSRVLYHFLHYWPTDL